MNHHRQLILLVLGIIAVPYITHATLEFSSSSRMPTVPFGGRVLSTKIPSVSCLGIGTGPVVLMSNLASGIGAASGSNIVGNIYGTLPLYATNPTRVPKAGQWILGNHSIIPSFSTCVIGESAPFPVKKTSTYGVSGNGFGM